MSKSRMAARLAAVQALYQHEMEEVPLAQLLHQFHEHRLGATIGDIEYQKADPAYFDGLVSGTLARIDEIDAVIADHLAGGWTVERLVRPLRQILRAGTWELLARPDVPVGSAIGAWLDVADALCDRSDTKFVNGVLDSIAKTVRSKR